MYVRGDNACVFFVKGSILFYFFIRRIHAKDAALVRDCQRPTHQPNTTHHRAPLSLSCTLYKYSMALDDGTLIEECFTFFVFAFH